MRGSDAWTVLAVLVLVSFCGAVFLVGQTTGPPVELQKAQGYMPPVVLVRLAVPDEARVCVEQPGGALDCRRVGELRKWARERAGK
jgi:hypothetical protein